MRTLHSALVGQDGPVRIACINKARRDLGVDFDRLTAALQKAYDRHFLPVWGYPVTLYNTRSPRRGDWLFIYLDDADEADALGYHDITKNGQPLSKVFVNDTLDGGDPISMTASHELFEMVIDPVCNLWAEAADGVEYGYEMCDPVEEDVFRVDGMDMCNFVYPAWFEPFEHPRGTKFDHLGLLKEPFSLTEGGYVITKVRGKTKERWGSKAKKARFLSEDRRGHRSEYRKPHGLLPGQHSRKRV